MFTTGVDQALSKIAMYKHGCKENIEKVIQICWKCDDQQQYKAIPE